MKKILVVDDDREIRELLKKRLIQEKYTVMTASDGKEAVIICRTSHPDLVLMDIAMPNMDGYETCSKIKQDPKTKDIQVLFLTGKEFSAEGIIKRCQELGACGFISKPCGIGELLGRINQILA